VKDNCSSASFIGTLTRKYVSVGSGSICAVFSGSAAFRFGEFIVSLSKEGIDSPMDIRLDTLPLDLFRCHIEAPVIYHDQKIIVEEGLWYIDLTYSELWPNQRIRPIVVNKKILERALDKTLSILAEEKREGGFSLIWKNLFIDNQGDKIKPGIMAAAIGQVEKLYRGFSSQNIDLCCEAVKRILGFGAGLTPSGDDFLTAFCTVLQSVFLRETIGVFCCKFIERMRSIPAGLTNHYGWSYFTSVLEGYTASIVVKAVRELLSGDAGANSYKKIYEMARIGNTSGVDMLAGLAQGFLCLLSLV
jgi:hypothetical protein